MNSYCGGFAIVRVAFLAVILFCGMTIRRTAAAPIGTENSIVTTGFNQLAEYTQAGVQLSSRTIPYPNKPGTETARDLIVDPTGSIQVYNGTFDPLLSTLSPKTGTWTHKIFPGWSTVNNGTYGGIASFQNYIYVTDMA